MTWIETLLIVLGASIDIFAAMECQGALVKKINKRQVGFIIFLFICFQMIFVSLGYVASTLIEAQNPMHEQEVWGETIAIIILACLSIRLIVKAVKNELIEEHMINQISLKYVAKIGFVTGFYTLLASLAFGFVGTEILELLIMMAVMSLVVVVAGVNVGYRLGFEQKRKGYIIGAIIFMAGAIDIVIRCFI